MVKITRQKGEPIGRMMSRFRDEVKEEGIIDAAREAAHHESPAEKRKKKKYRLERLFERQRSEE